MWTPTLWAPAGTKTIWRLEALPSKCPWRGSWWAARPWQNTVFLSTTVGFGTTPAPIKLHCQLYTVPGASQLWQPANSMLRIYNIYFNTVLVEYMLCHVLLCIIAISVSCGHSMPKTVQKMELCIVWQPTQHLLGQEMKVQRDETFKGRDTQACY